MSTDNYLGCLSTTADFADSRALLPTVAKPEEQSLTSAHVATQSSSITPAWTTLQNISLLPNELMAEIFSISCHADSNTFAADENRHKRTTPLILGKVCTHWRAITWSRPYIWSHISLCLSTPRYKTQVKLLSDWLTRSGVCPLTINLILKHVRDWTKTIPMELIQLLMVSANRWQTIDFVLPESWYSIMADLRCGFPLLVTVISQPLRAGALSRHKPRFNLFEFSPLLRDLHVNDHFLSDVDVPWDQLDRFTLQEVYLDECFYALVKTPNLRFCRIYTIIDSDEDITENCINLPLLQELVIDNLTWPEISRLLSNMTVPLLENLEISALETDYEPSELSAVFEPFCNQKCLLKRLKLLTKSSSVCEESEFVQYLRNIPSLEELQVDISMDSYSDPIDELLLCDILELAEPNSPISDDDITFLPNLQVFKFSGHILVTSNDYDDYLTSLIERRLEHSKKYTETPPISRLKVFEVITEETYPFTPSLSVKQRLSKLADEGLQLKVEFGGVSWF